MNKPLQDALKWIIGVLEDNKITYQITGGFAAHIYGSTREVNDIDIDISEGSFQIILEDVRSKIVYGPCRYQDAKWDLQLMTLNYTPLTQVCNSRWDIVENYRSVMLSVLFH